MVCQGVFAAVMRAACNSLVALTVLALAPACAAQGQPAATDLPVTPVLKHAAFEGRAAEDALIAWRAVQDKFERGRELSDFHVQWARGANGLVVVAFCRSWDEANTLYVSCYNTNIRDGRVVLVERSEHN